jgi:hypothetical protein
MSIYSTVQASLAVKPPFTPIASGLLQRQCACSQRSGSGECEEGQQQREGTLQRAAINSAPIHEVPPIVHEVLRSPGQALDTPTREFMEPRFGHDFSRVRVHTDAKAAESARAVKALAYTVGSNIVFRTNHYAPETSAGQHLLAHELAHVVQQTGTANRDELTLGEPGDQHEQSAHRAADVVCAVSQETMVHPRATHARALPDSQEESPPSSHGTVQPAGHMLVQRQPEDDPKGKYPPDWQHGAPTKPVEPDPHVAPAPGTKPEPKQGPYRTPQPPQDADEGNAPGIREKIANALKKAGIPPWAAAALITLIVAALLDPEPFTKVALLVGAAAAVAIFVAIGRQGEVPPSA